MIGMVALSQLANIEASIEDPKLKKEISNIKISIPTSLIYLGWFDAIFTLLVAIFGFFAFLLNKPKLFLMVSF